MPLPNTDTENLANSDKKENIAESENKKEVEKKVDSEP